MEVEINIEEDKKQGKSEGKLLVFSDVEYRICPSFAVRLQRRFARCRRDDGGNEWREDSCSRVILRGACGALRPGRLTFVLGPSGAGKSTLLHVLTTRRKEGVSGSVVGCRGAVLVAQHASLLPALTASEVLCFAAALKLPAADSIERADAVTRVSRQLGLEGSLSTRTPQLSGGERKRLSVACELLSDPPVLLLDEPTSGLDSVSSLSVVRALSAVAQSGRTVACVLHQPSSRLYSIADDILLLSDGRTLYAGAREQVPSALLRAGFQCPNFYNPADYLLEVASGEHTGDLNLLETGARSYSYELQSTLANTPQPIGKGRKISHENGVSNGLQRNGIAKQICLTNAPAADTKRTYAASTSAQLAALLWRCGISGMRDVHLSQLRLVAHALVALLLGALYAGAGSDAARVMTNSSCLFFFLLFLFFSNAMPTIHTFPAEADIVIQEHLNRWYSLPAYWISKILADLPVQILCATLFVIPAWILTGQPTEDCSRLVLMWVVCVLLTILAQTSGLAIGAAVDVKAGLFIVPASNIPMLMFSGYFIPYDEMPFYLRPIAWVSYFRYAFDAALQCVYGFDRETLPCRADFCMFRSPKKFLSEMALPNDFWGSVSALIAWILLFQASLMLILLLRVRQACK